MLAATIYTFPVGHLFSFSRKCLITSEVQIINTGIYYCKNVNIFLPISYMRGSRGRGGTGRGLDPPLKNHKNIGFLSNSDPGPLKNQHSMLDHLQHASETPFKYRFPGGPMLPCLWWYLDPPSPHQLKKNASKLDPL